MQLIDHAVIADMLKEGYCRGFRCEFLVRLGMYELS